MAGYKKYSWLKKTLRFKFPAGTSRGTYTSTTFGISLRIMPMER